MKKPIIESVLHPSYKWRQVISKRHAPQIQLTRIKREDLNHTHTHIHSDEKTKSNTSAFQNRNRPKHCTSNISMLCKQARFKGHGQFQKYTRAHTVLTNAAQGTVNTTHTCRRKQTHTQKLSHTSPYAFMQRTGRSIPNPGIQ